MSARRRLYKLNVLVHLRALDPHSSKSLFDVVTIRPTSVAGWGGQSDPLTSRSTGTATRTTDFDDETIRVEPIDYPFGPKVLPMCSE
jgi:hypothetical protein